MNVYLKVLDYLEGIIMKRLSKLGLTLRARVTHQKSHIFLSFIVQHPPSSYL